MIRWVFLFEEGSAKSDVTDEAEDVRIAQFLENNPGGLLALPGEVQTIFVNLSRVRCIARTVMTEEQMALESAQAQAAALAAQPAVIPDEVASA